MIVKVANKTLKQPMEIFIPDDEWEKIQDIENEKELNARLSKIALAQVSKRGYAIGYCQSKKKEVTLRDCIACGVDQGWGSGKENYAKWETCKKEQIHYQAAPHEPLLKKIKDKKIDDKLKPQSKSERKAANNTFSTVEKTELEDNFTKQSADIMKNIRKKEDK